MWELNDPDISFQAPGMHVAWNTYDGRILVALRDETLVFPYRRPKIGESPFALLKELADFAEVIMYERLNNR